MTTTARDKRPLSDHDPILGPVLTAHATSPPRIVALAVTCRALDAGITPGITRLWLRSRGGDRLATITASPRSFQPVLTAARRKVRAVHSLPARRRAKVAAARRLVGSLLAPAQAKSKVSPHRTALARHALAIIGLEILESIEKHGRTTALVAASRLALDMGVEERAAQSALKAAVELGWLRLVTRRPGGSGRYVLARLDAHLDGGRAAVADDFTFAVDALIEGTPSISRVAEVVAAAAHTAVSHDLGSKCWLTGLAYAIESDASDLIVPAVGADARALNVPVKTIRSLRRRWCSALVSNSGNSTAEPPLVDMLDRHAQASGAVARKAEAETARCIAAAARKAETEAHRGRKAKAYKALDRLLADAPIPSPDTWREQVIAWGEDLQGRIAENDLPEDFRRALAKALEGRMAKAGFEPEKAQVAAEVIVGIERKEVAR